MAHPRRMRTGAVAIAGIAAIALTACGGSGDNDSADGGDGGGEVDCAPYEKYKELGEIDGKTVSIFTSIVTPEDEQHINSYKPFEECTGITINYEGDRSFEAQLPVRVRAGNAPDVAFVPQPGLLNTLVTQNPDAAVAAGPLATQNVSDYYAEVYTGYGSVDGTLYAVPIGANAKSFVWYSPSMFTENGYERFRRPGTR